ncbi:hypothetical protein A2U01_0031696, partial [Trifolium medium]|nr:hypothetical protein [Trifolium medium]
EEENNHRQELQDLLDQVERQAEVDLESSLDRKFANMEALIAVNARCLKEISEIRTVLFPGIEGTPESVQPSIPSNP